MQVTRAMGRADVDWAVGVLARRRAALVPHAPLYWRPAADASQRHRDWLGYVIREGQGFGFRTASALMIAVKGPQGWTIDDAWVPSDRWEFDGLALWTRVLAQLGAEPVRFVCPVFEAERASFARSRGLVLATSWWHTEVEISATRGGDETRPALGGCRAGLVEAPPVYDPGGPVLFLQDVRVVTAIVDARTEAARCGAPLVVVDQPAGTHDLARALKKSDFTRHCDFLDGAPAGQSGQPS